MERLLRHPVRAFSETETTEEEEEEQGNNHKIRQFGLKWRDRARKRSLRRLLLMIKLLHKIILGSS